ncbi:hypothetical protein BLA24_09010 [Streptomyces cinnamoneus]|uniref:Uncharacterized protein n=1 Tax=Streptomyces cinnamoneus TaxID=53446 RepID=A0A2G1XLY8_STRCJ|nr:hypothetical protein [Streptomyces cinnamoneus]PHQ52191.1 hypothetical protein BLA24_09010 [Streptomyces cinnamoneus]
MTRSHQTPLFVTGRGPPGPAVRHGREHDDEHPTLLKRHRRTPANAALALALAIAGVGLWAPSATADPVSVGYTCTGPGAPDGVQSLQVTVTAPATVAQGGTAELTLEVATELKVPFGIPAQSVTGELDLQLAARAPAA